MRNENFEKAANDLYDLLIETQKKYPDSSRLLYLDIDGHRNSNGGFDKDMLKYKRENDWLCDYINLKRVSFKDICDYLKIPNLYTDYQQTCSFIHGQDITSKILPFTFYSSIYFKLYIMSEYMFRIMKFFSDNTYVISQIDKLYNMLLGMKKEFMQQE